jgi:hypothetical protein
VRETYIKKKEERKPEEVKKGPTHPPLPAMHVSGGTNINFSKDRNGTSDTVSVVSTTSAQNTSMPMTYYTKSKQVGEERLAKAMAKARARRAIQQEKNMSMIHKVIHINQGNSQY